MKTLVSPIFCIIPPHMLMEIAKRGAARQQAWALQTLSASEQIRGRRETVSQAVFAVSVPAGKKQRTVYDAGNAYSLPGKKVRAEGEKKTGDAAVNEAYDGSGATYDLFKQAYLRNSIDDKGMQLDSTVHYGKNYDNAFWNGSQMVYGDGDGDLFERFTKALDVIGHELTHGVTQNEANLAYSGQSGALNEHFSDVFGSLVKQWKLKQTSKDADWVIGAGLFTKKVKGTGIRSMKEPGSAYDDPVLGKDPQPSHMKDYKNVDYDNGGVHINSGIPNHAFYLAAVEMGGHAYKKAGKIWYVTLRDKLKRSAAFGTAAFYTFQAAGELYGKGSLEQKAVKLGWKDVGISVERTGERKAVNVK